MTKLVLDKNQSELLRQSNGEITLVDSDGNYVGVVRRSSFTPEEIAEAERRSQSGGPWRTTEQVMERLRSLGAGRCDTP